VPAVGPSTAPAPSPPGRLALTPARGPVGGEVAVRASGLPPGARVALMWHSVRGSWVLTGMDHEHFRGRRFVPASRVLAVVRADAAGNARATFSVPEDFGFRHRVTLERDGTTLAGADFELTPQATIVPAHGPPGTPITVRLQGVGYEYLQNSWLLSYDNRLTGWLSSVTTRGTAVAVIPAAGGPGVHVIRIVEGSFGYPYLNWQQAPEHDVPTFTLRFTVTDGPPMLPPPATTQGLPPTPGHAPATVGTVIWTNPQRAAVGAEVVLHGTAFPPDGRVRLTWEHMVGSHISGRGFHLASVPLGSVTAGARGQLRFRFRVPDDLGGSHRIVARGRGGVAAATSFTVTPEALPLDPSSGPAGTTITVHVKGGGWTDTANIYALVYDDAYTGFACAFNSQGDIQVHIPAAGRPGWHFIDLYPAIFQGRDVPGVHDFRLPQLTYAQDHPGERLPAFHWAFRVTARSAGGLG
jgi:hypothetical protein